MATIAKPRPGTAPLAAARARALARRWPVLLPAALYAASAIAVLATNYWQTEQGGQGPIILVTGAWLLWTRSAGLATPADPRRSGIAFAGILGFGLFSLAAAITVKQFLLVAGTYAALVCLLYLHVGGGGLRRLWPPLAYLAFLIPPPDTLVVPLTHALKHHIAAGSAALLAGMGYPVAQEGTRLFIGSYEVVVAAACAGLNSLFSLLAIGLFYVFLMHPRDLRYAVLLSLLIVPIALFANFARVVLLLLVTYHLGDSVAQGVVHGAAGMTVFTIALAVTLAVDAALHPWLGRGRDGDG